MGFDNDDDFLKFDDDDFNIGGNNQNKQQSGGFNFDNNFGNK